MINLKDIIFSSASFKIKLIKLTDYILGTILAYCLRPIDQKSFVGTDIKRILIIRPGGLGDAVFLLPIIQQLKSLGKEVDVLCENRNKEVFLIDKNMVNYVYCYDSFIDLWRLSRKSYDVIVDSEQWHFLSAIFAYFITSSYKVGFATRQLRSKLFTTPVEYQENGYELDNFQRLFNLMIPKQFVPVIHHCLSLKEEQLVWAKQQVLSATISVSIGSSISARRLEKDQLLATIRQCFQMNKRVILLGGKDVVNLSKMLVREINDSRLTNYVGKLTLLQSTAIIAHSERFLGVDSGLMHVACSVGVPVIVIFGPGNINKWQPKGDKYKIITANLPCAPCTKFGYTIPTCQGKYSCMREIIIDELTFK